ncbi:MAG: hypothetical protein MZW92_16810 [Comamonadaceae bacterium]|nr:hypothetical protein [Comamonadaceae bacterium]
MGGHRHRAPHGESAQALDIRGADRPSSHCRCSPATNCPAHRRQAALRPTGCPCSASTRAPAWASCVGFGSRTWRTPGTARSSAWPKKPRAPP